MLYSKLVNKQQRDTTDADLVRAEEAIRAGKGPEAQKILSSLFEKKLIDRSQAPKAANLLRRSGLLKESLQTLSRYVRPQSRTKVDATALEKLEYAATLVTYGAPAEALRLLDKIPESAGAQLYFYKSLALVNQWRYSESIALLQKYIEHPGASDYQKIVGRLNLLAALVFDQQYEKALTLAKDLEEISTRQNLSLIRSNSLEMLGQIYLKTNDYSSSEKVLRQAAALSPDPASLANLLVRKWQAILQLAKRKSDSSALLDSVRKDAKKLRSWETLRDCDYYEGEFNEDIKLLKKVFAGTPYPSYQEKVRSLLCAHWSDDWRKSDVCFEYPVGLKKNGKAYTLNIFSGENSETKDFFRSKSLVGHLLFNLGCDLYKPPRLPGLFGALYPDRFFNVDTSPSMIFQLLVRLRHWIDNTGLPMQIDCEHGFYVIRSNHNLTLQIPYPDLVTRQQIPIEIEHAAKKLRTEFSHQPFTSNDVLHFLRISERSARRLAGELVKHGLLKSTGTTRSRQYQFA